MMHRDYLILTAITAESRALRVAEVDATVIGIRASRLLSVVVPAGTRRVIVAGVGGGLDPGLGVGDVVVDGAVDLMPAGARQGIVHTVDRVISTVEEKAALYAATGAAVVDMEQSVVRRWADKLGLAVIGVRAVSDAANVVLDPAVISLVDDVGDVRRLVVAGTLARRPMLIGQLLRLNRDTKVALDRLAKVVGLLIR